MGAKKMFVFMLVLVLLLGVTTTLPAGAPELEWLKWKCPDVSVQANASIKQVVGEWFVVELVGTSEAEPDPKDACSELSFTGLRDEGDNISSLVMNVRTHRRAGVGQLEAFTDKPQEFVVAEMGTVFRLHSLSEDGEILVLAACFAFSPDVVYWWTLAVAPDINPPGMATNNAVRRDDNVCKELAEEREKKMNKV